MLKNEFAFISSTLDLNQQLLACSCVSLFKNGTEKMT